MVNVNNITTKLKLYRYDVIEPPTGSWSTYFKSPVYVFDEEFFGIYSERPKNEIGAYFFFNQLRDAIDVGNNVLKNKEQQIRKYNPNLFLWITECTLKESILMLDLTNCQNVVDLFVSLWKMGIDIFQNKFYNKPNQLFIKPFSEIREDVMYLAENHSNSKSNTWLECESHIDNFYNSKDEKEKLPFACQQLTDFSNGLIFKEVLEKKGFDGYIFNESESTTFCLFNSSKITEPNRRLIENLLQNN